MTLDEAKVLLARNNISFELREFNNEAEYLHHTTLFPGIKNALPRKVITMIIQSNNEKKNIELQFNDVGYAFHFEELWFGGFSYELFDYNDDEDMLAEDLIHNIMEIKQGNLIMIVLNDIRKKRWLTDLCFDLSDIDDKSRFQKALQRIKRPKGWFSKLMGIKEQYEIYDWNSYQCIVK